MLAVVLFWEKLPAQCAKYLCRVTYPASAVAPYKINQKYAGLRKNCALAQENLKQAGSSGPASWTH